MRFSRGSAGRLAVGSGAATLVLTALVAAPALVRHDASPGVVVMPGPRPATKTTQPLNLILITLDTTRADRLGAYGDVRAAATPALDRLAREGVLFEDATSPAPLTLPAHATLFTGRLPPQHGVHENFGRLDAATPTIATVLRARGYRTAGFVGSQVLARSHGLSRGFEVYDDDIAWPNVPDERPRRRAYAVIDRALRWLAATKGSSPFFAWIHVYDAHAPYEVMAPFDQAPPGRRYEAAIASIDAQIGRVRTFLDQNGVTDRTVIVVVGDHGEGLGDHGESTHGLFVYQSVLRVPFIIRAPMAGMQGRRVDTAVNSADLLPTVLDLLGADPVPQVEGRSLVPVALQPSRDVAADVYAENLYVGRQFGWSQMRAIRSGGFKLIEKTNPELYDLTRDPGEARDLSGELPAVAGRLRRRLAAWHERLDAGDIESRSTPLSEDVRRTLASLGYVAGPGPSGSGASEGTASDPRDHVALFNCLAAARPPRDVTRARRFKKRTPDALGLPTLLARLDIRSCR